MELNMFEKVCTTSVIRDAGEEGAVTPLIIDAALTGGLGLMNPSIFKDGDDWIVNVRNVSYTLHHCDPEYIEGDNQDGKFQTPWGPLNYVRPDNDPYLRTDNYVGYLNLGWGIERYHKINTDKFPKMPDWEFIGHEDGRLMKWDYQLWFAGVRRHAPDGKGRMQMSRLQLTNNAVTEQERHIIEVPDKSSYCEKNWMPILDMPFHFVKWMNPLEIVKVDPNNKSKVEVKEGTLTTIPCKTVINKSYEYYTERGLRGGSQVLKYKDYYFLD